IRATDAVPNPCRDCLSKITEFHFHPYRNVALYLNNLAARYTALLGGSKFICNTFVLRRKSRDCLCDHPESRCLSKLIKIRFLWDNERHNDISMFLPFASP